MAPGADGGGAGADRASGLKSSEPYEERDARAAHLAGERPHAAEILELYRRVLALERPLHRRAASSSWLGRGWPKTPAGNPDLGLEALPFPRLVRPLRRFTGEVAAVAPAPLAAVGAALGEAPAETLQALLERTLALAELEELAGGLGCQVLPLVFYSRAFLQPIAEGLAERAGRSKPVGRGGGNGRPEPPVAGDAVRVPATCPRCGWPPQVALLRDEPEAKGRRLLVCGLCSTAWTFPRVRCPSCGEDEPDRLLFHESEEHPYLRIEECSTCRAYVKAVDLRREGTAVPVVDDLASPELDVWADERGLWKIARNLMGM